MSPYQTTPAHSTAAKSRQTAGLDHSAFESTSVTADGALELQERTDRRSGISLVLQRISVQEWRRRMWHFAPGFLPILSWALPHKDPLSPLFQAIAVSIIVGLTLILLVQFHTISRRNERNGLGPVIGYAGAVFATLLLFPAHAELGMTVLVVLAFGDGSATLGGMLFRGPTLAWNRSKTWAGTLSFLAVGVPLASLAYWAESQPKAELGVALLCGTTATVVAACAESLPARINDNIRVGAAAAIGVVLTHALVVGL